MMGDDFPTTQPHQLFEDAYRKFDKVKFGTVFRQIEVMAIRKNPVAAVEILKSYLGETDRRCATMDSAVTDLFNTRTANALLKNGYLSLTAIDEAKDEEFLAIENFSFKTVKEIRAVLQQVKAGKVFEGIDDPDLYFQIPVDSAHTFNNQPIPFQKKDQKDMSDSISDAVGVLLDAPSAALAEINDRIEELETQIKRLKSVKKLLGGGESTNTKKRRKNTLDREKWAVQISGVKSYIEDRGPARPGVIATAIDSNALAVGRIANGCDEFFVNEEKEVCLSEAA